MNRAMPSSFHLNNGRAHVISGSTSQAHFNKNNTFILSNVVIVCWDIFTEEKKLKQSLSVILTIIYDTYEV